ncbi:GNAT family N-acetyltransferase [Pseudonocardia hispaniensis]|uniref:GNAT family N-acetyltransferase n=1 Tax=Pseudonocardia hispaniensis TaxID=904933 RepID=A0ABW1J2Q6_9PSEU
MGLPAHRVVALGPDQLRDAHSLFAATIHRGPLDDQDWQHTATTYSPGRTFGVVHDGALVGTATSFRTRTAVPGGAALPTAAVTRVGVRADHTRRGVLTAMMHTQLRAAARAAEPLASLRASEAVIYERFGYGPATRGRHVRVPRPHRGWRAGAPAGGSVRLLGRSEIVPVLAPLQRRLALRRAGGIERPDAWWWGLVQRRLDAREHVVACVHTGPDGDDGFAVAFSHGVGPALTGRVLRVEDLHAGSVDAAAGLWRFLLSVDLVDTVEGWLRPLDEPLELLLTDPRKCQVTGQEDETWLRLVDVPAALAARSWGAAEPVLLGVSDTVLPENSGVYRIGPDAVERVSCAEPELECDVAGLAAAYLGDRMPSALAVCGWWTVRDPVAVSRADALFAIGGPRPWCGTFF